MNGTAHRIGIMLVTPAVALITQHVSGDLILSSCACAGCVVGMALSPDLDQEKNLRGLKLIFYPYGLLFAHRSFWTHCPIIGTAIRIAYLVLLAWPVWIALGKPEITAMALAWAAWAVIGLACADVVHFICDLLGGLR